MEEPVEPPLNWAPGDFDQVAATYDDIREFPWYAWLFVRLHTLIVQHVIRLYAPQTVLDVGCGTGFQSFLYAAFGARVVGIDISAPMIRSAQAKLSPPPEDLMTLLALGAPFPFVRSYHHWLQESLNRAKGQWAPPFFEIADARRLPFRDNTFDHVNCCGSVLSLVPEHSPVLGEIARVLRPGGTLFLEAEGRWNGDLFWTLTDALLGGRIGYGMPWKQAVALLRVPFSAPVVIDYPFEDATLKLTLFTRRYLRQNLQRLGLSVIKTWTVHSLTNLIPSPLLHRREVPRWLLGLFQVLARVEERFPLALPGCSLVFLARKEV